MLSYFDVMQGVEARYNREMHVCDDVLSRLVYCLKMQMKVVHNCYLRMEFACGKM